MTVILELVLRTCVAALAAFVLLVPATAAARSSAGERSLLSELNAIRAQHGLGQLMLDSHLQRAAQSHSREMITTNDFTHGAFGTRMLRFDVSGRFAAENLAWGTGARGTARGIVVAWLASPEHRANLLRASFTRVGIGDLVGFFQGHRRAHVITADFAG